MNADKTLIVLIESCTEKRGLGSASGSRTIHFIYGYRKQGVTVYERHL